MPSPIRKHLPGKDEPGPILLELDLTEGVVTTPPADPMAAFRARRRTHLDDVIEGLRRAAVDDDVVALVAKIGAGGFGFAIAQELRAAVTVFRSKGKRAVAWSESFGELAPGTVGYYLATGFDEIWLQESGDVGLIGLEGRALFVRDALDRAGVQMQLGQRHEYKNAANMFLERELTPPHREAIGRIVESSADQIISGIADRRELSEDAVRGLVDRGPIPAADARDAGLVDHVGYRDEVYEAVRGAHDGAKLLYLSRYRRSPSAMLTRRLATRGKPSLAVVYGTGAIRVGRSGHAPMGGTAMGSDTVSAAIRAAVRAEDIKAIVFRVDSPGGSYAASDTIRREIILARRAGKPVVVSMGDVAGSGGYFVSMAADTIVASPGTITGSIGVLAGKPVLEDLLGRIGVAIGAVGAGAHAGMFSTRTPYTEEEWRLLNSWLDRVYDDFTAKVAADRDLSSERVHDVARGRIWTGADAKEHGLVDELGGLADAIDLARRKGGLSTRDDLADVRVYPRVTPFDRFKQPQSSDEPAAASATMDWSAWGPFQRLATQLGLPAAGPLMTPFYW